MVAPGLMLEGLASAIFLVGSRRLSFGRWLPERKSPQTMRVNSLDRWHVIEINKVGCFNSHTICESQREITRLESEGYCEESECLIQKSNRNCFNKVRNILMSRMEFSEGTGVRLGYPGVKRRMGDSQAWTILSTTILYYLLQKFHELFRVFLNVIPSHFFGTAPYQLEPHS